MPATNGIIQFKYGLQGKYDSLATKDLNTIYFTTDEQRLFVGDVEYSRPVGHGTSLPDAFVPANSMFVVEDGTRRELHYSKDGSAWDLIAVLPAEITAGIVGANTAGAVGFGGTIKIPKITYDKHGNITAAEDVEVVLPSETPVDVEVVKEGDGNAVTEISAEGDKITYKMGSTFAPKDEVDAFKDEVDTELNRLNSNKIDEIKAQDASLLMTLNLVETEESTPEGSSESRVVSVGCEIKVQISEDEDNILTLEDDGLKVAVPAAAEYSIVKAADSGEYAAIYNLTKDGTIVGASINIPKDLVVKSGSVVGDEIVLVLNDESNTEIKIPVGSLIEYVTSGSATGDMIVVSIDDAHKVTATITDGTVTLAKLDTDTQTKINKAHDHENKDVIDGITAAKISAWNAAEQNAKDYADDLDEAMGTRVGTAEGKITTLEGKMTTAEGNITNLQNSKQDTVAFNTAYDANTNKAATMADVAAASLVWQTI